LAQAIFGASWKRRPALRRACQRLRNRIQNQIRVFISRAIPHMRSITVASSLLVLSQLQVQRTYALHSNPPMPTACNGRGPVFFHFGLGAHGGESLRKFFHDNGFATLFYLNGELPRIMREDFLNGNDGLPQLQQKVADFRKTNACGNVFVGDIKPDQILKDVDYEELFRRLDEAFPDAVWIWLIRHPDKWATSLSHWLSFGSEEKAGQFLQSARNGHAHFHCSAFHYFGNRTLGSPTGNGKANVVQFALGQSGWPLFVEQLEYASGYKGLTHDMLEMPHVGHHKPHWKFPAPGANKFNSWDFLKKTCSDSFRSQRFSLSLDAPWDDEVDSGL